MSDKNETPTSDLLSYRERGTDYTMVVGREVCRGIERDRTRLELENAELRKRLVDDHKPHGFETWEEYHAHVRTVLSRNNDLTRQLVEAQAACAVKDAALLEVCERLASELASRNPTNPKEDYSFQCGELLRARTALSLTPSNALNPIRDALDAASELAEFHVGSQEKKNSSPSAQAVVWINYEDHMRVLGLIREALKTLGEKP